MREREAGVACCGLNQHLHQSGTSQVACHVKINIYDETQWNGSFRSGVLIACSMCHDIAFFICVT